ncbi:MAG TPA: beta-ketoacyl synthase N-terminal-like domain-containing protein [Streptosporangiaceae bacterium]
MHDAGCDEALWYNAARTGVILGVTGANALIQPLAARLQTPVIKEVLRSCDLSEQEAAEVAEKFKKAYPPWEENSFPGMLGNLVAGRIANRFDLGATNCTVDAACASSLAAIKMSVGCIFLTCVTLGRYLINRLKFGVSVFCGLTGRYRW